MFGFIGHAPSIGTAQRKEVLLPDSSSTDKETAILWKADKGIECNLAVYPIDEQ
jgi:hypothetical protein